MIEPDVNPRIAMDVENRHRLILKILIGAAWADRQLEPQEVEYIKTILQRYQLTDDVELLELLGTPIPPEQTDLWILTYLQDSTEEERMKLLAQMGEVLIADNIVSDLEHELLDEYYELMTRIPAHPDATPETVPALGKFVRRVIQSVGRLASGS